MSDKKMNVKLLRQVKRHILDEPKRFDMGTFLSDASEFPAEERPACGTVACIAGWAVLLTEGRPDDIDEAYDEVEEKAVQYLRLSKSQAARLFYDGAWPAEFYRSHDRASTRLEAAEAAARRIDHFIKTNGAE